MEGIVYLTPLLNDKEIAFSLVNENGTYYLKSLVVDANGIPKYSYKLNNDNNVLSLQEKDSIADSEGVIAEKLLALQQDMLERMDSGIDDSTEGLDNDTSPKLKYRPEQIIFGSKSYSVKQIYDLVKSGDIELAPNFQRNFIWDRTRQSRLIESIFLGLPLPSIYLNEYDDGRLTVVDGLQRISTILKFYDDKLKLSNLEYLKECNGKTYSELKGTLSPLIMRRFGQTQLVCYVIDYRSPQDLKYDLFRRLNTGGKPLNNQEIRNCLSREPLQNLLKEMVENDSFNKATGRSLRNTRMEAFELALRFIYFYDQYTETNPVGEYSGNMDETLNKEVDYLNEILKKDTDGDEYKLTFIESLDMAYAIFGDFAFRKVLGNYKNEGVRKNGINKVLLLTITVILAKNKEAYSTAIKKGINLTPALANLIETDAEFLTDISWATNARVKMSRVFNKIKKMFDTELLK